MGGPSPQGKLVLVAEDNKSTRDIVVHNLHAAGFRTVEAADGEQALALAGSEDVDLILLDIMMPKVDGFTVCATLRRTMATSRVPIIVVSARNEREDVVRAVESGANDFIVKPFTKDTLLAKIEKYVGRATSQRHRETRSGAAEKPDTKSGQATKPEG